MRTVDYDFVVDLEVKLETKLSQVNKEIEQLKKENETLINQNQTLINLVKSAKQFTINDEEIELVKQYMSAERDAKDAKENNTRASLNFSRGGESGSYQSPTHVIDLHFKWLEKSFDVCKMITNKLGL